MSRAEQEVAAATLTSDQRSGRLVLRLDSDSDEPRFEARWQVTTPSRLKLELEQGVGDIFVNGLSGGVDVQVGVGEVSLEVGAGDIDVNVGVGDATVRAPSSKYGSVDVSGGVGGAGVVVDGTVKKGEGFVSHSSSWRGDGSNSIELEVGVGDGQVVLD
jgi:hypothetical protein